MKKFISILAAVVLSVSTATAGQFINLTGPSGNYGDDEVLAGEFVRSFTFSSDDYNIASLDFSSIAIDEFTDLKITDVMFNGTSMNVLYNDYTDYRFITDQVLDNINTITVRGISGGNGSFSGNIALGTAVPEPSIWALLLTGFGVVGYSMRVRKASVQFA